MLKKRHSIVLSLGFLVAFVFVVGVAVRVNAQTPPAAQPKMGLAISPPTFELSANPGDTLKNSVRVDNITDEPLEVTVLTRNFTALGEEGGIDLSEEKGAYSLADWIKVSPDKTTIPARESKTFDYVIEVPQNAEPGGRFGSIVFKTAAKPVSEQSGVAIAQEVGALVFVKIAGEVKEKASIVGFTPQHGFSDSGPVGFDIRIKNEGNVQFKPTGTITISNFFGQKVATIPIDAQNVLPDATRKMSAQWDNFWLFGKYEATVSIVYGNNRQIITATTTFWGFPYKLAGIILVVAVLLGLVLYPRRKRIFKAFKVLFGKD